MAGSSYVSSPFRVSKTSSSARQQAASRISSRFPWNRQRTDSTPPGPAQAIQTVPTGLPNPSPPGPARPVVDEHGTLLGIVTTDDAWDAIEDDVAGDKTKMNVLSIAGITVASLMGLFLYSLILLQLAGSLHLGGLHY